MYSKIPSRIKTFLKITCSCLIVVLFVGVVSGQSTSAHIYAMTMTEIKSEYNKLREINQQVQTRVTLSVNTILQIVPFEKTEEETQPTPSPTPEITPKPRVKAAQTAAQPTSFTTEVIKKVNAERAKSNLPALQYNAKLARSAQNYAEEMAQNNYFNHVGKNGSDFILRNTQAGYTPYSWMGENIAAGQSSPDAVVRAWMASSGHKANIVHTKARETGVGFAMKKGTQYTYYWVQEFGAP